MGTSGSYAGSGGRDWNDLNTALDDWLDDLPVGSGTQVGDDAAGGNEPQVGQSDDPSANDQLDPGVVTALRPLGRAMLSGGRGSSGGGGTGLGGGRGRSGGRSPSGSGRSRARVGRVGGRLAAGVAGLRSGDATALQAIGLNLAELQALDPYRQTQRLLEAATEERVATTLEEDEVHKAVNRTAVWALTEAVPPEVDEVIRRFIVEYVYEVFLTECGASLRSGDRDGVVAAAAEDRVRATIAALARQVPVQRTSVDATGLGMVAEKVLEQTLRIHTDGTEK